MAGKIQVPVMGGLRKVVRVPVAASSAVGTSIAGFEGQSLTVAQMKTLLGVGQASPSVIGNSPSTPPGSGAAGPFQKGATWVSPSVVSTPTTDVLVTLPRACVLSSVTILTAGGNGSCAVDIWQSTYAAFPPVVGGSICGGSPPAISGAKTYLNTALTGFTTTFAAGTVLLFHLTSSSTFNEVSVTLQFA